MSVLLAIDPGNVQSGYVVMDTETYKITEFGKEDNEFILNMVRVEYYDYLAVEMIAAYGMPVGAEVFDTCLNIGRIIEAAASRYIETDLVFRKQVKMNLCGQTRAKDGNIIQALKDRFGDKGTKDNPGWFYGFKADCWQAYALGVTWIDDTIKSNAPTTV